MSGLYDIVCYDLTKSQVSTSESTKFIFATRDSRELLRVPGKRAIIVTNVRDPVDAKKLRLTADLIIYEITSRTTERELRRIIDNGLCDLILGVEQLYLKPGLHSHKILFNQVIASACASKQIGVVLNLRPFLFDFDQNLDAADKFSSLCAQRIRFIANVCNKYGVIVVGATLAKSQIESRNPVDLHAAIQTIANPVKIKL